MRVRGAVRPGRVSSGIAGTVGLGMAAFGLLGLFGLYQAHRFVTGLGEPIAPALAVIFWLVTLFLGFWTAAVLGITVYHALNVFRKAPPAEVVDLELTDPLRSGTADRLRELDRLRAQGLITPDEYATGRASLLDRLTR